MPENPYVRTATVEITEIVPERGELPECVALLGDGYSKCGFKARYLQNGKPVCGVHLGRPGLVFFPPRR